MGTSLQAFAVSKFIANAGYPNKVINYDEYSGHFLWQIKPKLNAILLTILDLSPAISQMICSSKYAKLQISRKQMDKFNAFETQYLPLTKRRYTSLKSLQKDFSDLDACICGSDQIWSPYFFDPAFFLSFISSTKTKKIAYAPSMGITDEKLVGEQQRELIKQIDYLSCREKEAAQIVENITGRSVPVVLDPTLMLPENEWFKMESENENKQSEKYILTYFLHTDSYQDSIPHSYIKALKEKTGLPVYNVSLFNLVNSIEADKQFDTIGPLDFLSLVKNAEWICTNSFHCCIFSHIFARKFFVFERYMKGGNTGSNQNSRIHTLLRLFEMEHCLTNAGEQPNTELVYNFSSGQKNLQELRNLSLNFLLEALKEQ